MPSVMPAIARPPASLASRTSSTPGGATAPTRMDIARHDPAGATSEPRKEHAMTDPTFLLALAAAILSGLSIVLHVVAPRTKNTIDDALRDDIDLALGFIRGQRELAKPAGPPPSSGAGAGLLVLAVLVLGGSQLSCATVKPLVTDAKAAVIDCVHADQGPIEALLGQLAWDGIEAAAKLGAPDWDALIAAAEARGVVIGGCAFVAFTHAHPRPSASSPRVAGSAVATPPPAPAPRRAAPPRARP